jgi:hypothetical protein
MSVGAVEPFVDGMRSTTSPTRSWASRRVAVPVDVAKAPSHGTKTIRHRLLHVAGRTSPRCLP